MFKIKSHYTLFLSLLISTNYFLHGMSYEYRQEAIESCEKKILYYNNCINILELREKKLEKIICNREKVIQEIKEYITYQFNRQQEIIKKLGGNQLLTQQANNEKLEKEIVLNNLNNLHQEIGNTSCNIFLYQKNRIYIKKDLVLKIIDVLNSSSYIESPESIPEVKILEQRVENDEENKYIIKKTIDSIKHKRVQFRKGKAKIEDIEKKYHIMPTTLI